MNSSTKTLGTIFMTIALVAGIASMASTQYTIAQEATLDTAPFSCFGVALTCAAQTNDCTSQGTDNDVVTAQGGGPSITGLSEEGDTPTNNNQDVSEYDDSSSTSAAAKFLYDASCGIN